MTVGLLIIRVIAGLTMAAHVGIAATGPGDASADHPVR